METYPLLRQFADSWGMLAMLVGFIGIVAWVLPGRPAKYRDAADTIFRHEDRPADADGSRHDTGAGGRAREQDG